MVLHGGPDENACGVICIAILAWSNQLARVRLTGQVSVRVGEADEGHETEDTRKNNPVER